MITGADTTVPLRGSSAARRPGEDENEKLKFFVVSLLHGGGRKRYKADRAVAGAVQPRTPHARGIETKSLQMSRNF